MISRNPCGIRLFAAIVGACLFGSSVQHANGQTEAQVVAKITKYGEVFKNRRGKFHMVLLDTDSDKGIESIDFGVLVDVKSLWMVGSGITDRTLAHMRRTMRPGLTDLTLHKCRVSEKELALLLRKHPSLIWLALDGESMTDQTLMEVSDLKKLTSLSLGWTKITDKGLKSLRKLENLDLLDVGFTRISDEGLSEIAKMSSLKSLFLDGTKVTDMGIRQLSAITELQLLRVSSTKVTDNGKAALKKLLPDLEFGK